MTRIPQIDELKSAWAEKDIRPITVSDLLSKLVNDKNYSIYKLALTLGARAATVAAYLDFSTLSERAKYLFEEYNLPVTFAIDLANHDPDFQEHVLENLCDNLSMDSSIIDDFESRLYQQKIQSLSWKEALSGKHLMHVASKAKNYGALSGKARKALFTMGRTMNFGKVLTKKQRRYLDSILDNCQDVGILKGACFDEDCDICKEISDLLD